MRLRKTFRQRGAPDFILDVDCEVGPGVTAIFGPSGSGKSTWLECIAGLQQPDAGRVALNGRTLSDVTSGIHLPPAGRNLGYVFQNAALFPHMTVQQNVEYGLVDLPPRERAETSRQILETFHIAHLAGKHPAVISGGERQRVALARALVRNPQLILLDEPFSALDYVTKLKIMDDVLYWNHARNLPILMVTHALEEVFAMADRVIVLEEGRVIASGKPPAVLAGHRDRLLASLTSPPYAARDLLS